MKTLALLLAAAFVAAPPRAAAQDQDWAGAAQAQLRSALKAFKEALPRPPADVPNADWPRFAVVHVIVPYDASWRADKAKQDIERADGLEQLAQMCRGRLEDLDAQLVGEAAEVVDGDGMLHLIQLCKDPGPSAYNVVLLHSKDTHYLFSSEDAEKSARHQLVESCAGLAPDAELIPGYVRVIGSVNVDTLQACRYKKPF